INYLQLIYIYIFNKKKLTFARLIVGDHQRVNLRLGIWFKPDRCALVSFLYFIDSSKPLAFSQNKPSHVGKYVPKQYCTTIKNRKYYLHIESRIKFTQI